MSAKPGDLFVVRTGGLAGAVIRLGTRSQVNHAGVVIAPARPGGPLRSVEASPGGARLQTLDHPTAIYNDTQPLTDAQRDRIQRAALGLIGTPYSWLDILAMALLYVLGVRSSWVARRVESSGHVICSQLADLAYQRAGVELFDDGRLPGEVSPGDLLLLLARHAWQP